jgi:hypothetical protein
LIYLYIALPQFKELSSLIDSLTPLKDDLYLFFQYIRTAYRLVK